MMAQHAQMERMTISSLARSISMGMADEALVKAVLIGIAERGETAEDLMAFAAPFLEASVKVSTKHEAILDMCGTGGAKFRTFNVSTLASIVVSSLGVPVAKHGNRSSNGKCGSADLMEALGFDIHIRKERAEAMLDDIGFAFLYAPSYHPAMRHVAPIRKDIGKRTIFNILGPMLNPVSSVKRQLIGVPDVRSLDVVGDSLFALGIERGLVIHGAPGMDEVSTLGPTEVVEVGIDGKSKYQIDPRTLGIEAPSPMDVGELSPLEAASMARDILDGSVPGRSDMVMLNAAFGLYAFGLTKTIGSGVDMADKAMRSGKAVGQLDRILSAGGIESGKRE
ncbi:MAG: anthranilate phosphoribosyltransferase [Methanomassiliicoccales archaeon]